MRFAFETGWQKRLVRNLPFVVSAFFFCSINTALRRYTLVSYALTVLAACAVAAASPDCVRGLFASHKGVLTLSALGTLGVCWFNVRTFMDTWRKSAWLKAFCVRLELPREALLTICGVVAAALAAWFVFVLLCAVYRWLWDALKESGFVLERRECIALVVMFLAMSGYMLYVFSQSVAFYGAEVPYDVVYTSDSGNLVRKNAYLFLRHVENDIRQPLFAVFAAPFVAPMYAVSLLLPFWPHAGAILMNLAQVAMLLFACTLLVKLTKASVAGEIALTACFCATYMGLLFTVMMEQYIVTVFWLTLTLYLTHAASARAPFALIAACGTMMPSVIVAPALCLRLRKSWKDRLLLLVRIARNGFLALCLFGRLDIIASAQEKLGDLSRFTGKQMLFTERLIRYTSFVSSCFTAPAAGQSSGFRGNPSWQMQPVETINWLGVVILVLALVGLAVNRRDWLSQTCGWWAAFSFTVLCIVGWGIAENGQVLYALYFGWAYFILLFKLLQWSLSKLCIAPWALPAACGLAAAVMLWVNIPELAKMLQVLSTYYQP